jgi:Mg2+/Co2+ transporter CorB
MLRRVALVRINVSEELSASFIRVTRIGDLGTTLACQILSVIFVVFPVVIREYKDRLYPGTVAAPLCQVRAVEVSCCAYSRR